MITNRALAIILGGGQGSRLYPLTKDRSKPAVPIAGKFRLIDIPISNCLNSGIKRMFVLTQFNSTSLNRHIKNAFTFDRFTNGFVDILAAEQTRQNKDWFQGTADAVRQSVAHVEIHDYDYILVLSGDQLYQMDFEEILNFHKDSNADLTVATIPVVAKDATAFGIMKTNADGIIEDFVEKPPMEELHNWKSELPAEYTDQGKDYVASMGIYVFSVGVLTRLFDSNPEATDFGKEIIPYAVSRDDYTTASYPFGGYWTDIGNISSFFEANLRLAEHLPEFNLYDNINKIYTNTRMLSPTKFFGTQINQALISEGCIIHAMSISHSIVGIRSRIGEGTIIDNSYLMGIDFYQTLKDLKTKPGSELIGVGANCIIRRTIIDKNAKIGDNCKIVGDDSLEDVEMEDYCIKQGIIIINKGAHIPSGTKIGLV